jgi:hypothetical protein
MKIVKCHIIVIRFTAFNTTAYVCNGRRVVSKNALVLTDVQEAQY